MCSAACMLRGYCIKEDKDAKLSPYKNDASIVYWFGRRFVVEYHNIEYLLLELLSAQPDMTVWGQDCRIRKILGTLPENQARQLKGFINNRRQSLVKKGYIYSSVYPRKWGTHRLSMTGKARLEEWRRRRVENDIPLMPTETIVHPNPIRLVPEMLLRASFWGMTDRVLLRLKNEPTTERNLFTKEMVLKEIKGRKAQARKAIRENLKLLQTYKKSLQTLK